MYNESDSLTFRHKITLDRLTCINYQSMKLKKKTNCFTKILTYI